MKFKLIIDKNAEEELTAVVHEPNELTRQIENLILSYQGTHKISAYKEDEMIQLCFSDIECITVIDRKIFAIDGNGVKYRLNRRLCDLEEILPTYFIRINKSTLANENRILRFATVYTGAVNAVFKCGYEEYVSRRCFSEIKRRLNNK